MGRKITQNYLRNKRVVQELSAYGRGPEISLPTPKQGLNKWLLGFDRLRVKLGHPWATWMGRAKPEQYD
jgi:hypothetical protein